MKKDGPELTREVLIRSMAARYLEDAAQLNIYWQELDADERAVITALAKTLYPEDINEQERTTRALLVQKLLDKTTIDAEIRWAKRLTALLNEPASPRECCKES